MDQKAEPTISAKMAAKSNSGLYNEILPSVDVINQTIAEDEWLRLRCLELATQGNNLPADVKVDCARRFYAFVKESGGKNVINAARDFGKSA